MFSKLKLIPIVLTWRVFHPVELLLKYLVNFINPYNMGLKYDIHFNRMSNYIIHIFYVGMGSFAWLYLYHECVAILEKINTFTELIQS